MTDYGPGVHERHAYVDAPPAAELHAWTAPRTWTVGEVVTAAMMNAHVRDNLKQLYSEAGTISPGSNASTTQSGTVTFTNTFASTPAVVLGMDATSIGNAFILQVDTRTTTGFNWTFKNTSGVTYSAPVIQWIAKII